LFDLEESECINLTKLHYLYQIHLRQSSSRKIAMETPRSDAPYQFLNQAVIAQQFCAPYPIELTVQKKAISLSDGDFKILDSNGNLVLTVDGKVMSIRDKRILRDQAGNILINMRKKLLSLHETWEAYRGEGTSKDNLFFTAGRSSVFQLRTSLEVNLGSNSHADFKVQGSFFERSCTIYQGTAVIAQMRRKYTASNVLLGRDTFAVIVNPGVDYAFIVALVVILDEINKDEA